VTSAVDGSSSIVVAYSNRLNIDDIGIRLTPTRMRTTAKRSVMMHMLYKCRMFNSFGINIMNRQFITMTNGWQLYCMHETELDVNNDRLSLTFHLHRLAFKHWSRDCFRSHGSTVKRWLTERHPKATNNNTNEAAYHTTMYLLRRYCATAPRSLRYTAPHCNYPLA